MQTTVKNMAGAEFMESLIFTDIERPFVPSWQLISQLKNPTARYPCFQAWRAAKF